MTVDSTRRTEDRCALSHPLLKEIYHDLIASAPPAILREKLRKCEDHGEELTAMGIRLLSGILDYREKSYVAALEKLTNCFESFEALDDQWSRCIAATNIGILWSWKTDTVQAYRWFSIAISIALRHGHTDLAPKVLCEIARLNIELGDHKATMEILKNALTIPTGELPDIERQRSMITALQCEVRTGNYANARIALDAIGNISRNERLEFLRLIETARVQLAEGHKSDAITSLERASHFLNRLPEWERSEHKHASAELALAHGDTVAAMKQAEEVLSSYSERQLIAREIEIRKLISKISEVDGDEETAKLHLMVALNRSIQGNLPCPRDELVALLARRGVVAPSIDRPDNWAIHVPEVNVRRYVERATIAYGRNGSVRKAYDIFTGKDVVVKKFVPTDRFDHMQRARMLDAARRELAVMSNVQHPNLCRVFGMSIEKDGAFAVVSEFIEGQTLRQVIGSPWARESWADIGRGVCQALGALHASGYVHCDLKPDNIIIRDGRPVIIDFDTLLSNSLKTQRAAVGYTPGYASPEQLHGRPVTTATDIYALGTILHEIITGQLPDKRTGSWRDIINFGTERRRTLRHFSCIRHSEVADLLWHCLDPFPKRRPSASQVLRELSKLSEIPAEEL